MPESLLDPRLRLFSVKTRRGKIALIAREHYLRNDVDQYLETKLKHYLQNVSKDEKITHYMIPDSAFLINYIELLEFKQERYQMTDLILLETCVQEIREGKNLSRTYKKIKNFVLDGRRRSMIFANDHFDKTYVVRDRENETIQQRNYKAICTALKWLSTFLPQKQLAPTILVTDDPLLQKLCNSFSDNNNSKQSTPIKWMSSKEYMATYWNHCKQIKELYETLSQLVEMQAQLAASQNQQSVTTQQPSSQNTLYEEYLPDDVLDTGVKTGSFVRGSLNVNSHNPEEAYVRVDLEKYGIVVIDTHDILIPTPKHRNRAIHGDVVAVQILPQSDWISPSGVLKTQEDDTQDNVSGITQKRGKRTVPTGKVVGVLQRNTRQYVATIQLDPNTSVEQMAKQERVIAIPMDYRIPKIRIRTRQLSEIINSRIVVNVDNWEINSMYPNGHYVYQLGEIGKLDTEVGSVLVENNITISPFAPKMLADIPPSSPPNNRWQLPESDIAGKRRDLRFDTRVFSIDPIGSQDIDDALSVKQISKNRIQVGVHIADVTYFLERNSLLDLEARARSTTVYLSDRKFDMLPTSLSEDLASLREKVDRPAVSVIWEFNSKMEVTSVWYGRTAIRSCHELNYELAQRIIDEKCSAEDMKILPDYNDIRGDLLLMVKIARKLKQDRINRGAVELASTEIRFELNNKKDPINIIAKKEQEINGVVAEYMIFANMAVAEKIYKSYPSCALLRRHSFPRTNRFDDLIRCAKSKGFTLDTSSNKALAASLNAAVVPGDQSFNYVLRSLATLSMEEAEYISTGSYDVDEFYHYGLAADFYTHFTSPIRRYADVMVHRQLLDSLHDPPEPAFMSDLEISELANHINGRHRASKQAQRDSSELFQSLYFKTRQELADALVYDMKSNGFLVFVPKYGIKGTVYLKDRDGKSLIPPNGLSASPGKYNSDYIINGYSLDEDTQQVLLQTNRGNVAVSLFDHMTIKILVQESRSHRNSLRFELVHFGSEPDLVAKDKGPQPSQAESVGTAFVGQKEMSRVIKEQEVLAQTLQFRVPESVLLDYTLYAQTDAKDSMYILLQSLGSLSLEDQQEEPEPTGQGTVVTYAINWIDQSTRYWKIKKRPKPKVPRLMDDIPEEYTYYDDEEYSNEEAIGEKRAEILVRNRDKMPVEQKYQEQIGKMEVKMRAQRKK